MPPEILIKMRESKILRLSVSTIKALIKINKLEQYYNWDGDLDGGVVGDIVDPLVPKYVRAALDGDEVLFIDKEALDDQIAKLKDEEIEKIIQRITDRVQVDFWKTDYLDWYYDLIDPIYSPIVCGNFNCPYVNLYDYIIDKIYKDPKYELQILKNKIQDEIYVNHKWMMEAKVAAIAQHKSSDQIHEILAPYEKVEIALKGLLNE